MTPSARLTVSSTAKEGNTVKRFQHFTEEEKETARRTDLAELLRSHGEVLEKAGSEYEWYYGCQKITIRGNLWYNQYTQEGGDVIDFLCCYFNRDYPEAVDYLLGDRKEDFLCFPPREPKKQEPLILPKPNDNMRRAFAYLLYERGVDRDVLYSFAHHRMIYESKKHHNVVFVGYDKDGIPRHAHKRGTGEESTYKGNALNSVPEFSFHWHGESKKIYLFEAPIDMLSYISMHKYRWKEHSYAAACSVSDKVLFRMLEDNPLLKEVYLCFDNDEAGQKAAQRISDKLFINGIKSEILIPDKKDWNEDLKFRRKNRKRGGEKCPT